MPIYALRNAPCPQNTNLIIFNININGLNNPQIWSKVFVAKPPLFYPEVYFSSIKGPERNKSYISNQLLFKG